MTVLASSFRPSPDTYVVALAWLREEGRFHEEGLFIPSERVPDIAQPDASHEFKFDWHPGSPAHGHLEPYRARLSELRSKVMVKLVRSA